MPLTVPNAAEGLLLNAALGKTAATAWTLRLYTAIASALSNATVVGDFTEAVGGGYAAILLTAANWVTTPGSPTSSAYPEQTFTFTGALTASATVIGYYITNAAGAIVAAEAISPTFQPANNGDTQKITPTITLASVTND